MLAVVGDILDPGERRVSSDPFCTALEQMADVLFLGSVRSRTRHCFVLSALARLVRPGGSPTSLIESGARQWQLRGQ